MNPHSTHPASMAELFASVWRNRRLILSMTRREVQGRYRGSFIGLAWSFFNPLLMLAVYTFIFSVVFQSKWHTDGQPDKASFAIFIFVGMILLNFFSECANRSPTLILMHQNYVKKVVFPLEILPWITVGSALFHAAISLVVLLAAQGVINHHLPWTVILFPLAMLPLILGTLGVCWLLAALGVYVRDVSQVTMVMTSMLMFASPVFFPVSALPERFQLFMRLNPLTPLLEMARETLILQVVPDPMRWLFLLLLSLVLARGGFWWFQKTRKGFADVL